MDGLGHVVAGTDPKPDTGFSSAAAVVESIGMDEVLSFGRTRSWLLTLSAPLGAGEARPLTTFGFKGEAAKTVLLAVREVRECTASVRVSVVSGS